VLAGVCTMSIIILPTIIRTTEESLASVPDIYREGSYGLGAGKLRTVLKVVLPSALPGIVVSVVLSIGRIVGETAALILTAGTAMRIPATVFNSAATLSVFMYILANEGQHIDRAYTTAIVLMITVFIINLAADLLQRKLTRN